MLTDNILEDRLSRPMLYNNAKLFPGEFSAIRLATHARLAIAKFKEDYRTHSFYNLIEWRMRRADISAVYQSTPCQNEYKTIVNDSNVFKPYMTYSMQANSELLAEHLASELKLKMDTQDHHLMQEWDTEIYLSDQEIIDLAMQHNMPIFVSIDGSYDEEEIACNTICIVAPDIRDSDALHSNEWQNRMAKVLLIHSWRLPEQWGTGKSSINMAEAVGLILGEYTIPSQLPIIYITDSNNARTLQRNIKHLEEFTHRKKVRQVKQGIYYSIANHLEHLTKRWRQLNQLSAQMRRAYENGKNLCKIWAEQHNTIGIQRVRIHQRSPRVHMGSDIENSDTDNDSDTSYISEESQHQHRYHFDQSMVDILDRVMNLKVYSHQPNQDFTIKYPGNRPSPNLFIVSANQFADNTVTQAHLMINNLPSTFDHINYPPFSPRWCFTFDGKVTNKGATSVLYSKMDDELCLRLQHREKQGILCRLFEFNGIKADYIGNESLARNVIKGTAPCLTRSIYRHPSVANLTWKQWYNTLSTSAQATTSCILPRGWQKIPSIANNIIKRCPFCKDTRPGDLEHLHLYCQSPILVNARLHCYEKIEDALYDLYNFASMYEYNQPIDDAARDTKLKEQMERAALDIERQKRTTVQQSTLIREARATNIAILRKQALTEATMLRWLPVTRIEEYNHFLYACRLGMIHFIPEDQFNIATATITDVGYLGLFPKGILQVLQRYTQDVKRSTPTKENQLNKLIEKLITAFIYRPITIQKTIQIMLAKKKKDLDNESGLVNKENGNSWHHDQGIQRRVILLIYKPKP